MRRFRLPFLVIALCTGAQNASADGFNWNGFYAGFHLGGVWGKGRANDLSGWNGVGNTFSTSSSGFNGGVQAGYNWLIPGAPVVIGIEGDLGYMGIKGSAVSALALTQSSGTTVSTSGSLYGTVRGRLGVA